MTTENRMKFIPELKEKITNSLKSQGVNAGAISSSFTLWENGEQPLTPWEKGCFEVFKQVQDTINNSVLDK